MSAGLLLRAGRARLARARAVNAAHPLLCALIPAVPRVVLCSRECAQVVVWRRAQLALARLCMSMMLRTVSCSNGAHGAQWSERLA